MKTILLALLPSIVLLMGVKTVPAPLKTRADLAADAILAEASKYPEARRDGLARVAFVWSGLEGGWVASPEGYNDAGRACGTMQVHLTGERCRVARASVAGGVHEGMMLIDQLWTKCGTLGGAMVAYSVTRGVCPGKSWVVPVVAQRCKLAGLASTCEAKS